MEGSSRSRPRVVEGDCQERGLGIISLRALGIEAQFERKSLLLDRNPSRWSLRLQA